MNKSPVKRVAIVGTGVIGASWAAHFLAHGLDVVATDPAPDAEHRLRADVAACWPLLEQFGLAEGASPDRLSFTGDPVVAVADADFVQENGPEREDIKHALFDVDMHVDRDQRLGIQHVRHPPDQGSEVSDLAVSSMFSNLSRSATSRA